jgi:hypothetical protein
MLHNHKNLSFYMVDNKEKLYDCDNKLIDF